MVVEGSLPLNCWRQASDRAHPSTSCLSRQDQYRASSGRYSCDETEGRLPSLAWRKKVRNRDIQCPGEDFECAQGYITLAALNRTNVGSMKPTGLGERFLRQLMLLSIRANVVGEDFSELGGRLSHDGAALKRPSRILRTFHLLSTDYK